MTYDLYGIMINDYSIVAGGFGQGHQGWRSCTFLRHQVGCCFEDQLVEEMGFEDAEV